MRFLTILLVIVASCFASYKYSPHHHADSPFKTLYMHLMPVPLLVDNHAPHGEEDALLTVPLPESLGALDWTGRFAGDHGHGDHAADVHGPELAVYNLQIFQIAAILIILIAFSGVPAYLRTGKGDKVTKTMAGFCMWLKEDVVHPVMGDHFTHKFLP